MRRCMQSCMVAVMLASLSLAQYGDISELKVARPEDRQDVQSVPPPSGAIVLFDGKSLDNWVSRSDGKSAPKWQLQPGGAVQVKGGDIHTREKFAGKFKLHVEFRVPYMPKASGQGRGNSGVYVQGRYEVHVLDSYGLKPQMGDCGAIYGVAIPTTNACKAPTVWQSYDIEFTSPVFKEGKQVEPARMTVFHNGVKIHDNQPLVRKGKDGKLEFVTNTTAGMGGDPSQPGPIMLQDHGDPVQYRNIWLLPLKD